MALTFMFSLVKYIGQYSLNHLIPSLPLVNSLFRIWFLFCLSCVFVSLLSVEKNVLNFYETYGLNQLYSHSKHLELVVLSG